MIAVLLLLLAATEGLGPALIHCDGSSGPYRIRAERNWTVVSARPSVSVSGPDVDFSAEATGTRWAAANERVVLSGPIVAGGRFRLELTVVRGLGVVPDDRFYLLVYGADGAVKVRRQGTLVFEVGEMMMLCQRVRILAAEAAGPDALPFGSEPELRFPERVDLERYR